MHTSNKTILITLLVFAAGLFAQAAWIEPANPPPPGDAPLRSNEGGTLHRGPHFQKKDFGSFPSAGYAGGCPGSNAAHPNSWLVWRMGESSPCPPLGGPPLENGSIEVGNVFLREAAPAVFTGNPTNKYADNLLTNTANRGTLQVGNVVRRTAVHATGPMAVCPANSGLTEYKLVGCSATISDFRSRPQGSPMCNDPEACGLVGAYPVNASGNYTNVNPSGCKALADDDNSMAVVEAYCLALERR